MAVKPSKYYLQQHRPDGEIYRIYSAKDSADKTKAPAAAAEIKKEHRERFDNMLKEVEGLARDSADLEAVRADLEQALAIYDSIDNTTVDFGLGSHVRAFAEKAKELEQRILNLKKDISENARQYTDQPDNYGNKFSGVKFVSAENGAESYRGKITYSTASGGPVSYYEGEIGTQVDDVNPASPFRYTREGKGKFFISRSGAEGLLCSEGLWKDDKIVGRKIVSTLDKNGNILEKIFYSDADDLDSSYEKEEYNAGQLTAKYQKIADQWVRAPIDGPPAPTAVHHDSGHGGHHHHPHIKDLVLAPRSDPGKAGRTIRETDPSGRKYEKKYDDKGKLAELQRHNIVYKGSFDGFENLHGDNCSVESLDTKILKIGRYDHGVLISGYIFDRKKKQIFRLEINSKKEKLVGPYEEGDENLAAGPDFYNQIRARVRDKRSQQAEAELSKDETVTFEKSFKKILEIVLYRFPMTVTGLKPVVDYLLKLLGRNQDKISWDGKPATAMEISDQYVYSRGKEELRKITAALEKIVKDLSKEIFNEDVYNDVLDRIVDLEMVIAKSKRLKTQERRLVTNELKNIRAEFAAERERLTKARIAELEKKIKDTTALLENAMSLEMLMFDGAVAGLMPSSRMASGAVLFLKRVFGHLKNIDQRNRQADILPNVKKAGIIKDVLAAPIVRYATVGQVDLSREKKFSFSPVAAVAHIAKVLGLIHLAAGFENPSVPPQGFPESFYDSDQVSNRELGLYVTAPELAARFDRDNWLEVGIKSVVNFCRLMVTSAAEGVHNLAHPIDTMHRTAERFGLVSVPHVEHTADTFNPVHHDVDVGHSDHINSEELLSADQATVKLAELGHQLPDSQMVSVLDHGEVGKDLLKEINAHLEVNHDSLHDPSIQNLLRVDNGLDPVEKLRKLVDLTHVALSPESRLLLGGNYLNNQDIIHLSGLKFHDSLCDAYVAKDGSSSVLLRLQNGTNIFRAESVVNFAADSRGNLLEIGQDGQDAEIMAVKVE